MLYCDDDDVFVLLDKPHPQSDDQWLSQVEILTHAPPTRRLWMGPQFSFKSYQSPAPPSSSTMIGTPSPPNTIIYTEGVCLISILYSVVPVFRAVQYVLYVAYGQ